MMKNDNLKKFLKSLALAGGVAVAFSGCHDAKAEKDAGKYSQDRPDDALESVTKSIVAGDAGGFAALCTYPIQRPYPLRDIEDSVQMKEYFPVMIDDSIRTAMKHIKAKDWANYGWRGWSLKDSNPIWYDEGIQFVDYESRAERGLRAMLAREEIESLAPGLRRGWTPVITLVQTDGDWVFRIDRKGPVYRLAGYAPSSSLVEMPEFLLDGSLIEEGSAQSRDYLFSGPDGKKAEYAPDSDNPDALSVTIPPNHDIIYQVRPSYWRDLRR